MAYCTKCGSQLPPAAKFCPVCGSQIASVATKGTGGYKQAMYKKAVQKLQSQGEQLVKEKLTETVKKSISQNLKKEVSFNKNEIENFEKSTINTSKPESTKLVSKGLTLWTWIYLAVNILMVVKYNRSDELMGIAFFSVIVLIVVFIRKSKQKPYNWLVKIILGIQLIFLAALIFERSAYPDLSLLFLIALLLIDLRLLFKGNKK
ncbi:MAG: zinc ribbon domain-containing protein [Flavobacteriaceae bacterium]|nr:zinc ribbon domain-containing protein [Flavobacteriaceae bacterium]